MEELNAFFNWALARRYLTQLVAGAAVLLIIVSGFVWWHFVYENPYNVYWGMLANSMTTSSVTKHITQDSSGTNLDQYITLSFGTKDLAYGRTTLTDSTSKVTTESIGTIKNDYVRYVGISTTQKMAKEPDFSSVLGKWAKADAVNSSQQTSSAPFFVQAILGFDGGSLVPFSNLPPKDRSQLLNQLHQSVIFDTSYANVKKQLEHGRPIYAYKVAVEAVAYVAFQKAFAADLGLKALNDVDPNSYQGQSAVNVTFSIDARSHHLVNVGYPGTNHVETYGSYGVPPNISLPTKTISDAKLQSLLGGAQ